MGGMCSRQNGRLISGILWEHTNCLCVHKKFSILSGLTN